MLIVSEEVSIYTKLKASKHRSQTIRNIKNLAKGKIFPMSTSRIIFLKMFLGLLG